jgi:D-alanine-D-alanine ligase-like ATP-grasp enzyme
MQHNVQSKIDKNAKIAVLCGGMSSEREVSLRSGKNCYSALLRLGFENAVLIDVQEDIAEKLRSEKIEYAFNNPEKMKEISYNARKTILENYSLEKIMPKQFEFLEKLEKNKDESGSKRFNKDSIRTFQIGRL